jgi:hypothetical protein
MFSSNSTQKLVHLPRQQPARAQDLQLPRGECRKILPDVDPDGSRQRCSCVSFSLNHTVPGSSCGCGHPAWNHVSEATGEYVPAEEYIALLEKFKTLEETSRQLREEVIKERREREKAVKQIMLGTYNNLANLKYYVDEKLEISRRNVDDKVEGILDKADGAASDALQLNARVADIDEAMMRLEERIDSGRWQSRGSSLPIITQDKVSPRQHPVHHESPAPQLPFRGESKHPDAWDVRVILVPRRNQQFAFSPDSIAYRRCQTRGLHQDLHLTDHTSQTFIQCTEASFTTIIRGRRWTPLQCLRSSDMSLCPLSRDQSDHTSWEFSFLESQCLAHDKLQGDIIFITLQDEDLSWKDIYSLPCVFGSDDEQCWEHSDELEGTSKEDLVAMDNKAADKMETDPTPIHPRRAIDTDSVYEYSPPPYSSRAYSDSARHGLTGLDALATASSMADQTAASISDRSIDSIMVDGEHDEHRDKRTKHTALRGQPLAANPGSPQANPPPQAFYYSGRVKRKMVTGKQKEPLDWRVSEMNIRNPVKGLLHRHESKDKDKRPATSGSGTVSVSGEASSSHS